MQISALCLGLLLEIPPNARLHSCCSMEDVMDMALTACLTPRPEEGQETVGSWLTEVVPGTFPHASGSLIQPGLWLERVSAPLHTREGGGGGNAGLL